MALSSSVPAVPSHRQQTPDEVQASLSGLCSALLEPEAPDAPTLLRVAELVACFKTEQLGDDSLRVFVRCSQCLELEPSGELALALGHTLARVCPLAHGPARAHFLRGGALDALLRVAAHPLLGPAHAAATGLANLFAHALPGAAAAAAAVGMDRSTNDAYDWEYRRQLLEHRGGAVLRAVGHLSKRLAESEATAAEEEAMAAKTSSEREYETEGEKRVAPRTALPSALGARIEGVDRLGFGGKTSIPTADITETAVEGCTFCRSDALADALAMVIMQLSQPPPQDAYSAAGAAAVADGRRLVTQRFCEAGGLFALVRLCAHARPSAGSCATKQLPKQAALQQAGLAGLRAMLTCTMLHVSHLVPADAVLMGATVDFAKEMEPRIHAPAIGVLCQLATVESVRPLLRAGGALAALKSFKVSTYASPMLKSRAAVAVRQLE